MDFKEMNPLGLIGVIGAVIMIVGVFMNWFTIDPIDASYTGWDIWSDLDEMDYHVAPLLCLIVGILSVALMVLPTVMNAEKFQQINSILGIVTVVLSIVAFVVCILWMTQDDLDSDYISKNIGFWLCFAGAIITVIGGVMPILKNSGIIKF